MNLGTPLPIQLPRLPWEGFAAEANPFFTAPLPHSWFICSLFKIWICETCDVGRALPPQVSFPNQTLAFRTGFVTQLCTLWSDVLNLLALVPKCLLTSEGMGYCHKCGVVIRSGVSAQGYVHNIMSNWSLKWCLFCC